MIDPAVSSFAAAVLGSLVGSRRRRDDESDRRGFEELEVRALTGVGR